MRAAKNGIHPQVFEEAKARQRCVMLSSCTPPSTFLRAEAVSSMLYH